ncbi:hypothetical protein RN001_014530 [Aquatica leii]|uniref:Uncharacterized protein n=1 Tax=Aquatica leii TaxID=1421715 RepID=A0AAN7NZQ5_9COLE|nr:hypothetical protein RN001_014530 [Aquatica leii]
MKDSRDIQEVFQNLNFDVTIYNDFAYEEILEKLSIIAKLDYSNYDCLVIFVLTHGKKGKIFARDVDYYPDVYWTSFNEKPSFMYKPKLIFIQGPRGDEADDGARLRHGGEPSVPTTFTIPFVPDVLVMYSCHDVFFSWRSRVTGSSFVQSLCKEFKRCAKNTDLLTLLTFVNRRMSMDLLRLPNQLVNRNRKMPTIVNNPQPRLAHIRDCKDIEEVFHNLHFEVTKYHNLAYKDVLEKLSTIAKMDYSNYGCLIIFVLTRGKDGKIFALDTDYYPDVYWNAFNESSTLMHKPKLIFIQSPYDDEEDDIVRMQPARFVQTMYSVPEVPDVLLMYSCFDMFISWRSNVTGSSFVQCLCKEFKQRAENTDLLTILTYINRAMSVDFAKSFMVTEIWLPSSVR